MFEGRPGRSFRKSGRQSGRCGTIPALSQELGASSPAFLSKLRTWPKILGKQKFYFSHCALAHLKINNKKELKERPYLQPFPPCKDSISNSHQTSCPPGSPSKPAGARAVHADSQCQALTADRSWGCRAQEPGTPTGAEEGCSPA